MTINIPSCLRAFATVIIMMTLSGCLVSVPIAVAKVAIDGVSYIATGKSTTDHALSGLSGQDCALHRVLAGNDVCTEQSSAVADQQDNSTAVALAPVSPESVTQASVSPVPYPVEDSAPLPVTRVLTTQDVMRQFLQAFDDGNNRTSNY